MLKNIVKIMFKYFLSGFLSSKNKFKMLKKGLKQSFVKNKANFLIFIISI